MGLFDEIMIASSVIEKYDIRCFECNSLMAGLKWQTKI